MKKEIPPISKPIDLKLEFKRLEKELDDLLWERSNPQEINRVRKRIEVVKLKLGMGQTHDADH